MKNKQNGGLSFWDYTAAAAPLIGGIAGTALGGPAGTALGTGAGQLLGQTISYLDNAKDLEQDIEDEEVLARKQAAMSLLGQFL